MCLLLDSAHQLLIACSRFTQFLKKLLKWVCAYHVSADVLFDFE